MRLYTPASEQELVQIETQVQEALASTLDYHLKRPEKLRELTCRVLGFANGYQQLKEAMASTAYQVEPLESAADKELKDFLEWVRTTTEDILSTRELHGTEPRDAEQYLVEIMDEVVFEWCGTGKQVSDGINNHGLEAQVEACWKASGTFEFIVRALEDEMPEMGVNPFSWSSWRLDTRRIPEGMTVYLDEESGEWAWSRKEDEVHSWDIHHPNDPEKDRTFSLRTEAVEDAIDHAPSVRA